MDNESANQNEPIKECRCCQESDDAQNMISPCDCSGSIKYIHRICLKQWIETTGNFQTCNVCRTEYNGQVVIKGNSFLEFVTQDFAQLKRFLLALVLTLIISLLLINQIMINLDQFNEHRMKRNKRPFTSLTFYRFKLVLVLSFMSIYFIILYIVLEEFKEWQKDNFIVEIV
jgi:hypothetical protein